jgi:aspartate racemase
VSFAKQTSLADLRHSAWADQSLLDGCSALTGEELRRDLRISHNSILETLRHIYAAERVWLLCLRTTADWGTWRLPMDPPPELSLDELQQSWPELWEGFRRWLEELPESGLAVELKLQLPGDAEQRLPRWKILRHVLHHSTLHRGQVVGMIRMLGHEPPPSSPMDYYLAGEPGVGGRTEHATELSEQGINASPRPRTFGLVAGLGVGAGIFYYRALVDAHLALGLTPRIVMAHADVRRVMNHAAAREADELAHYLAGLLEQLARAGAEIAAIPAFSPQVCAAELAAITPLPLVSLLDAIDAQLKRQGVRRVALFGARVTMETQMFGGLHDVDVIAARPEELDRVASIYVRVVEEARASDEDYNALRSLAHTLIEREKLDAIIFAGTDLAFVFNGENTDFPHVDGARVHLKAIMAELLR